MGSLVQLGTVPEWVQAAAESGALYLAVRGRWQRQAIDWAKELERLSGRTTDELRQVVEDSPVLAELVGVAWEEAARTASEDKRRLLAKVVAAALRDPDDAEVHELPYILQTVMALEPSHVRLLVVIATPQAPEERRSKKLRQVWVTREELERRWNGGPLLDPGVAALERQGLIHARADGNATVRWWELGLYGQVFFNFLKGEGEAQPPT